MSTAARKARKRAGIKFARTPKVPTATYIAKSDRKHENRLAAIAQMLGRNIFGGRR